MTNDQITRVVLVGAHGHGRWHLANLRRLASETTPAVRLVGVADPRVLDAELRDLTGDVPVHAELGALLEEVGPDVTIVCTPIHTHVDLALQAMAGGSHVLLEKPPAPTLAEHDRLVAGAAASGLGCQIGFQSLGSHAVAAVRELVAAGAVGQLQGIGAAGAWQRSTAYFGRAAWAGRRQVDGVPVVDGALTNAFAHAVVTALALDGSTHRGDIDDIEVELYRANDIEADDTSSVRLRTRRGTVVTVAASLCAQAHHEPYLLVHGSEGTIRFWYKQGRVRLETPGAEREDAHPATDLLLDLARRVHDPDHRLLVPPEEAGAFMEVVEAVRTAPEPLPVAPRHRAEVDDHGVPRVVVPGVDEAVHRCAERLALLSEVDAPFVPAVAGTRS